MEKVELKTKNTWTETPNGDGFYKIKRNDGKIEFAVIIGEDEKARIKTITCLWDSEPIHHPIYENALFLGPLEP